jgi:hypothetical protein
LPGHSYVENQDPLLLVCQHPVVSLSAASIFSDFALEFWLNSKMNTQADALISPQALCAFLFVCGSNAKRMDSSHKARHF